MASMMASTGPAPSVAGLEGSPLVRADPDGEDGDILPSLDDGMTMVAVTCATLMASSNSSMATSSTSWSRRRFIVASSIGVAGGAFRPSSYIGGV